MSRLSPDTLRKVILSLGTHRSDRPLTPVEVAAALEAELAAGTPAVELATMCQLENSTMITRFRRLLRLAPTVRYLVDWGQGPSTISFTVASHLARLRDGKDQEAVASAALEHRLSSGEIQQIVQIVERASVNGEEAVKRVLHTRPSVEKHHLIIGAVVGALTRRTLAGMTQSERDRLLHSVIKRVAPPSVFWGGKLGPDRFSLVGDAHFAAAITSLPGGFEDAINEILEAEVRRRVDTPS